MEVMQQEKIQGHVEKCLKMVLGRYFAVDCKRTREGGYRCAVTIKNTREPLKSRLQNVYISKSESENVGFIYALVDKVVHELIYYVR